MREYTVGCPKQGKLGAKTSCARELGFGSIDYISPIATGVVAKSSRVLKMGIYFSIGLLTQFPT